MAFRFLAVIAFGVVFCLSVQGALACQGCYGCSCKKIGPPEILSRKMLTSSETVFKGFRSLNPKAGQKNMDGWDLRWVPSGPDPLHHSSSPKKPQTP